MSVLHEIIAPKENADDTLLVSKLYFKNKDLVSIDDELIDLETSKTAVILESTVDGFIEYLVEPGVSIEVGEVIIRIHDKPESVDESRSTIGSLKRPYAGLPLISKKAQEYILNEGVDISNIQKHFIKLADVETTVSKEKLDVISITQKSILASLDVGLEINKMTVSLAKQTEIAALLQVKYSGLTSTIFYNLDDCMLPKSENLILKSAGSNLPVIAYEVARLLKEYPILNSYFENNNIMKYVDINLGIAIDIDDGLKVYTINNSDELDFKDLEYSISQGIYNYFRKQLTVKQITGSTFTITDLSSFGVDRFIPLINYKQSAILGISAEDKKLKRLTLSLTFDHRVTEGKVVSRFLSELCSNLMTHSVN